MQEYSFKMKCQADTLGSKTSIMIKDQHVKVENEYHCLTGYGLCKTTEHCPRRWWHGSSCPALLSCRQAFQRSLLSTQAQGKLYQVQGLGHTQN